MTCRGIRGAICADANREEAILTATHQLLERIVAANGLSPDELTSAIFTTTPDLDAAYPARAARRMGWTGVPLLCMQEMAVADTMPRCIRVLLHWNTGRAPDAIRHVYLGEARALRPDLVEGESIEENKL
ncbi:MAG: chorismate mutase [Chloroflexota bacterium]|nr:chorismate mutase [Chloroflexota bacterium]